jgi:hypothetical protein
MAQKIPSSCSFKGKTAETGYSKYSLSIINPEYRRQGSVICPISSLFEGGPGEMPV